MAIKLQSTSRLFEGLYSGFRPFASFSNSSKHLPRALCKEKKKKFDFSKAHYGTAVEHTTPLSPAVRYLVYTNSISDISRITATGPGQRLLKGDVLQYIEAIKDGEAPTKPPSQSTPLKPLPAPLPKPVASKTRSKTPSHSYTDVPVDPSRAAAAGRVTQHKSTTPHVYTTASCSVDRAVEMGYSGPQLTAFFVKAAALTIKQLPESNSVWLESGLQSLPSITVSVGSVTLSGVNAQSISDIASSIEAGGKLSGDGNDVASIRVSHIPDGVVSGFTSVLTPWYSTSLSIGSPQLVPNEQGPPSHRLTVTLTSDARAMDYEMSSKWLDIFINTVQSPEASALL